MDWQSLINIGAAGVLGAIGWFVRIQFAKQEAFVRAQIDKQEATAKELTDLRVRVAQDYVTHAHLRDIKDSLIRIESKLDTKVDKE